MLKKLWPFKKVGTELSTMEGRIEKILQLVSDLQSQQGKLHANISALVQQKHISSFAERATLARIVRHPMKEVVQVDPPLSNALTFDEVLERLEKKYTKAFPIWMELMKVALDAYKLDPPSSLSVEGNVLAGYFRDYVATYIKGRVLDIGCGIAEIPLYLQGYPVSAIAGIDPEEPQIAQPFLFVRGVSESIPWCNESFETVIIATSLDHVLSLDETLSEIKRVLTHDGCLLIWVGFIPGGQPYDPFAKDLTPVDKYHLFHFDEQWFESLMKKYFICRDKVSVDGESYFYCFSK